MVTRLKQVGLLVGVLVLIFAFSGFVSTRPQADVGGWTAIDLFVREQIDVAHAKGTINDPHFVDELTDLVLKKFNRQLDAEISQYSQNLTPRQREVLKHLIVSDYVSYLYQKSFYPKNARTLVVKPIKVASIKANGKVYDYYYAPMSSSIPYPIHWWVQVRADIDGGSGIDDGGYSYNVDGKNDLFNIVVYYTSSSVQYELHFYDEDHPSPSLDKIYDSIRCSEYPGRDSTYGCEDVESIRVENGNIIFSTTFSTYTECGYLLCHDVSQTYATPAPTHGYGVKTYSSSVGIYVSNTWNHLMDTVDTNPSMEKVWWYTSWS
ncbi:hypothetical protein [Thermococcus sp. Bubb.Bath]|uniref:hypothetical protein n=1 Tax=Thermococcus sp. Bubb.Bath TaxID=1638242 RepID=UPI001439846B|nr:hypothetical protein [Thermococcus sp. Bubb.Bath]NJF25773.1 hypothetical protein [Thermococcus sp. Bubb.Bath]